MKRILLASFVASSVSALASNIPDNAEYDQYAVQGWTCRSGYAQDGERCMKSEAAEAKKGKHPEFKNMREESSLTANEVVLLKLGNHVQKSSVPDSWSVSDYLLGQRLGLWKYCLQKNGENWNKAESCDVRKDNVEVLAFDVKDRTIYLGANWPTRVSQGERMGNALSDKSGKSWECFYGAFGTADRKKDGYTVCSSAFSRGNTKAGEAVIGNMLNHYCPEISGVARFNLLIKRE